MKLAVIGFTRAGCEYGRQIEEAMRARGHVCTAWGKGAYASSWQVEAVEEPLREWTGRQFQSADALIFVGAAGIAVRSIAPFVQSKAKDPAVLCMDEQGTYVISLLSGHLGGANALTEEIAALCGARPVITTATDVRGRFSVDDFARREGLFLTPLGLIKPVSARILERPPVGFSSDFECVGEIPTELTCQKEGNLGISISLDEGYEPFLQTLHLIPRITVLGIGCRKGVRKEQIASLVREVMEENHLSMHSICKVASIDLKREEQGLVDFCQDLGVPFLTYSQEDLETVSSEEGFSESEFVRTIAGVGNVCERSALKASGQTKLVQKKRAQDGVTVAVALKPYQVRF